MTLVKIAMYRLPLTLQIIWNFAKLRRARNKMPRARRSDADSTSLYGKQFNDVRGIFRRAWERRP